MKQFYCYDCKKFDRRKEYGCKDGYLNVTARSCQMPCNIGRAGDSTGLGDLIAVENKFNKHK